MALGLVNADGGVAGPSDGGAARAFDAGPDAGAGPDTGPKAGAGGRLEDGPDGGADGRANGGADAGLAEPASSLTADAGAERRARAMRDTVSEGDPAPASPAQRVRVRGRVLAKGGRDPLGGATVTVGLAFETETQADGRFEIEVPPGPHRLQVQFPGYEPADIPVEARPDIPELTLRLMPRLTGERYETVISRPSAHGERTVLREEELTRTPGSLGDPFRVLESLPGVVQVAWPMAIYAVRGANPGNTGFFLDGVRLPALFHFALGPAVIHPYFLEQMEFYPGGYPARFGRYVSGIVAASTAPPKPDRVRGSADVRLFDAGGIVATPWNEGRGAVAVAGRYSYTGLLLSRLSPDYTLRYWDYQVRADHTLGSGKLTLFSFGSGDLLGNKQDEQSNAEIYFHRLDLRWEGGVGPGRLLAATAVGSDRAAVALEQLVRLPIRAKTRTVAPRLGYSIPGRKVDWELGADADVQRFRPSTQRADAMEQDLFRDRLATSVGAYVAVTLRPSQDLSLSPGMRYDAFFEESTRKFEPEPRLSVRFRPFGETWLKAHVGRFAQMASLPVAVPGFEGFGLSTFGTQSSVQGSLGVEQPLSPSLRLDVTGFYQRLLLTDLRSMFNYDPQDAMLLELREGESYGVEIMLRRAINHRLYGWLSYMLSWSQRLVAGGAAKAWSDWDQRHVLNLVSGYRLRGGYSIGARFHINTGRPYPVYAESGSKVDYIRLPAFYQLDLRADKRFYFDRYTLDVYLEFVNATMTREVLDVKRKLDGTLDEKAYRIVLPSLGVRAEW
jgi:hypothetical protein